MWSIKLQNIPPNIIYSSHLSFSKLISSAIHTNRFTLSLNLELLFRMPHTCAIENGGLNTSPESLALTPPSHQTRLLRVRSSRSHGSRHRAPLSSLRKPNIPFIAFLYTRFYTRTQVVIRSSQGDLNNQTKRNNRLASRTI